MNVISYDITNALFIFSHTVYNCSVPIFPVYFRYTDSGNYTCTAPNAVTSYVLVYVTEGWSYRISPERSLTLKGDSR